MTSHHDYVATTAEGLRVAETIAAGWAALDADGHFLARNLDTGEEFGFDVDALVPLVSVAKVPIALVALDRIAAGRLDATHQLTVDPATATNGPAGVSVLAHPARIAIGDLVTLMLTLSDNAAADLLIDELGIRRVSDALRRWDCGGLRVRHPMARMQDDATRASDGDARRALTLAIAATVEPSQIAIGALDPARGNIGSARDMVTLLQRVWRDQISRPPATAELRRLMGLQPYHHRLSADLRSDAIHVSGKTGTFLNLRHEVGVVESDRGDRIVIAALTRSSRMASVAHDIDLAIGAAARTAFETLRG